MKRSEAAVKYGLTLKEIKQVLDGAGRGRPPLNTEVSPEQESVLAATAAAKQAQK